MCRLLETINYAVPSYLHLKLKSKANVLLLGKENISYLVNIMEEDMKSKLNTKKEIKSAITMLKEFGKKSKKKPILPLLREYNHFNVGDKIVVYLRGKLKKVSGKKFIKATVIDGFRHHDGLVSFEADEKFSKEDYLQGKGGCVGSYNAEVLLETEFRALINDPDFTKIWLKNTPKTQYSRGFAQSLFRG